MLTVRDVRLDDAEAVVALLNPIIKAGRYTTFVTPFTASYERAFIESFPARGHFLGTTENGELRGFQVVTP